LVKTPDYFSCNLINLQATEGGLFAMDKQNPPQPFIFKDIKRASDGSLNWIYDTDGTDGDIDDEVIDFNPDNDGMVGEITISLNIEEDGEHYINHQAIDKFGNKEPIKKQFVKVDNTPPVSSIYPFGGALTSDDLITISADDLIPPHAVGVDFIHYEIWQGNNLLNNSDEIADEISFRLINQGNHEIKWYAVDKLGNVEKVNSINFTVDDTSPHIIIDIGNPKVKSNNGEPDYWVTSNTKISIDVVNPGTTQTTSVKYRLNNGPWYELIDHLPYDVYLTDEIRYELEVRAYDGLNPFDMEEMVFYVDNTPPDMMTLQPVTGGWYYEGSIIDSVVYAVDVDNPSPYCKSVGIKHGEKGEAYLIDVYPYFKIVTLNCDNFIYDSVSREYIGSIIVPSNNPVL
jgi:hypothetical protein